MNQETPQDPATADPAKIEHWKQSADHAGKALSHGLHFLIHFVAGAAPIAQAIGTVIGNPAVASAAGLAAQAAQAAEAAEAKE